MPLALLFDEADGSSAPGWVKATLRIGAHAERVRPYLGLWSRQDYSDHWQASRELCANGAPFVVFAASRTPENWDVWVGRKTADGYRFFNCLAPLDHVRISNKLLSLSDYVDFGPAGDTEVSMWDVVLADITG